MIIIDITGNIIHGGRRAIIITTDTVTPTRAIITMTTGTGATITTGGGMGAMTGAAAIMTDGAATDAAIAMIGAEVTVMAGGVAIMIVATGATAGAAVTTTCGDATMTGTGRIIVPGRSLAVSRNATVPRAMSRRAGRATTPTALKDSGRGTDGITRARTSRVWSGKASNSAGNMGESNRVGKTRVVISSRDL